MKTLIKNLGIIALTMVSVFTATAQEIQRSYFPARQGGWWTLGVNGGWAYQQSDVPSTFDGYGFGMTLGKNMYYQPGAALSFDWRGRWLYSQTLGLDTKRATGLENNTALNGTRDQGEGLDYLTPPAEGSVFQNHKTQQFELGLEGVLTANRLRERTGVIASLYGGVNLDWYNTKLDQANNNGIYDYSGIDQNDSKSSIKSTLQNNILDGNYETNAHGNEEGVGKVKFMPSLGVELGYQFTPRFSMHVGHKATFGRTDDLDGELWDNNNNLTGDNDIHHYTNLGLQWIIDPRERRMDPPIINVTRPGTNPYISRTTAGRVEAKIENVRNRADVTVSVNGYPNSFSYDRGRLRVNFPLEYGENEVIITASNEVGTDEETVIIYYGDGSNDPVINTTFAPKIRITNPSRSPHNTENENFTIQATIENIRSKNDIEFFVNGRNVYNFDYNNRNDQFSGGIRLVEGRNEIEIIARNEDGSDRDNATIIYEKKILRPSVRITTPARNPSETSQRNVMVRADITNVNTKNDIRYFVNGRERTLFNYDSRRGEFSVDLSLVDGRNEVVIRATNEAGNAEDDVTIIYRDNTPTIKAPRVTITNPSRNTYETTENNITIRAELENVTTKRDVRFYVNGREKSSFNFNSRNGRFSANIDLVEGRNEVVVKGYNEAGNDEDDVTIIYTRDVPTIRAPRVTITNPSQNTFETTQNTITVRADIENVTSKNDVRLFVNGNERSLFNFNSRTGKFDVNLNLVEGSNDVVIKGYNEAGNDEDDVTILLKRNTPTIQPPVVTITSVSLGTANPFDPNPSACKTTVKATILNIDRKSDITFRINGSSISNFTFNTSTKVFESTVNLEDGRNNISIRAINSAGSDEDTATKDCDGATTQQQLPEVTINKPSDNSTTENASVNLNARVKHVQRKRDIRVKVNGNTINNFSFSPVSGVVTAKLTVQAGYNTISVWGKNNDGEDEASVRVRYNAPSTPPTVQITQPVNNTTTENQKVVVKAKILNINNKGDIRFTLNGKASNNFSFSTSSKTLSANVDLKEGSNTIVIKATNADGQDEESVRIRYNAPKNPPTVQITQPSNNTTTDTKKAVVKAKVLNVSGKGDIQFTLNGRNFSSFSYSTSSKTLSANVDLKEGNNTITIKASTRDGSDSESVRVKYETPKVLPSVKITSPKNNTSTEIATATVKATIKNVNRKSDVKFLVNGKQLNTFNLRRTTFTANITLKEGANIIRIEVKNNDGNNADQVKVTYTPKVVEVPKPVIKFINPKRPGGKAKKKEMRIQASVKNVRTKNQIKVKLNGKDISFSFDSRKNEVTAPVSLKTGTNKILIEATNEGGTANAETTIKHTSRPVLNVKKPEIVISSVSTPTASPLNPGTLGSTIIGVAKNISDQSQITITHNGKKITNFTFEPRSKRFQVGIVLDNGGTNKVTITATNRAGTDTKEHTY